MASRHIERLFIANRGEIARRIAITARRLGIASVAIVDRAQPPAYLLNIVSDFITVEEESTALYLDGQKMIELALASGCDALHPGFGFLSENAAFARAVQAKGLVWVGPNPKAIEGMASKAAARDAAEAAGVPVIRGLSGFPVPADATGDFSALEAFAAKTGYPLLMKAALGGGGKGMRLVHQPAELREAALRARSEAVSAFGDGALVCERYLTAPRHVEVQVLADHHGNIAILGDRDCSLQRRHQKVIEEAPAPELTDATRQALHDAARRLAAQVRYDNAGTVEFLVDWSDESRQAVHQSFFFLEMNTRLQVEHPVTEEVMGLDLVEWQLRIAAGETLPEDVLTRRSRGHSIEVRLYAEDPRNGYFPAPGPVAAFVPAEGPGIRWELGLDAQDRITGRFDPMVAKLVATGANRGVAMARLHDALRRSFFAGPPTNLELLIELTAPGAFAEGPVTTHYLVDALPRLIDGMDARRARLADAAEALLTLVETQALDTGEAGLQSAKLDVAHITEMVFAAGAASVKARPEATFAPAPASAEKTALPQDDGSIRLVGARASLSGSWRSALDASSQTRSGIGLAQLSASSLAAAHTEAFWYAAWKNGTARQLWVSLGACTYTRADDQAFAVTHGKGSATELESSVMAPVPGKVIAIRIQAGGTVKAGEPVFILESMKMEFEVKASRDGCVGTIHVSVGDQVKAGQQLAEWNEG